MTDDIENILEGAAKRGDIAAKGVARLKKELQDAKKEAEGIFDLGGQMVDTFKRLNDVGSGTTKNLTLQASFAKEILSDTNARGMMEDAFANNIASYQRELIQAKLQEIDAQENLTDLATEYADSMDDINDLINSGIDLQDNLIRQQEEMDKLRKRETMNAILLQEAEKNISKNIQERINLEEAAIKNATIKEDLARRLVKINEDILYAEQNGYDLGEAYDTLLKSREGFLELERKNKIEGMLLQKKWNQNQSDALALEQEKIALEQRGNAISSALSEATRKQELALNAIRVDNAVKVVESAEAAKGASEEKIKLEQAALKEARLQAGYMAQMEKSGYAVLGPFGKIVTSSKELKENLKVIPVQFMIFDKLLSLGFDRFEKLDQAAENFRRTTGFTNTQMADLRKNVESVNKDFAALGVTIENAYKAAQALTDVFGRTSLVTKDAIENIALMSANLGVVEADAAEALSIFQGMGGATQDVAMNTMMAGAALSEKTGVPFSKVMGDIAKSSGTTAMLLGTTPSKLMKAAIAARALGTDLNTIAAQQEKLLNYSDSINSELEASALLGRSISFQRARQLAYEGKVEESAKATLDMVKQAGDFNEMNIYQRKALAAASGMELKDLTKMMAVEAQKNEIRTKGTAEQQEQLKMQEAELEKLRKTNDLTKDSVLEENKKAIAQAKIQGLMTQINNLLDQMKTTFADLLEPVITPLIKILIPAFKLLSLVVKGIAPIIKGMVYPFQYIAEKISEWTDGLDVALNTSKKFKEFFENDVMKVVLGAIGVIGSGLLVKRMFFGGENPKSILEMVKAPFDAVKNGAKNIMQRVTGKSSVADMIGPKLPDASKGIADTAKATERTPSGTGVKEFLTNLASGLKKMGDGKVLLGALNLIPASVGLVAMVPGFAGAKLLENINGEALNTALSSLAEGLKKMAGARILKGALNLIPASIGLVAMIPGFVGIKLLENINGEALNTALSSLAEGLKSMSSGSVAKGAIVMTLASLGFVGMTVGAIGLGAVALLGEAAGAGLVGLSVGLAALSGAGLGVLVLLGISAAFVGFGFAAKLAADAFVSIAKVIPDTIKPLTSLALISPLLYIAAGGIGAVAMAFGTMGLVAPGMLIAGAAIALISISISSISAATESAVKNIPNLAESLTKLAVVSPALYAASSGLIALAGALGLMATVTIPATAASISIYLIAKSVEKLGTSFEQVSKNTISLAKSIPAVVNPIKQFASINMKETSEGMMMLSNSLASFGVGSAVAGIGSFIGNFLGGDPIAKMEKLASISDRLKDAASAISQIATATSRFSAVDSFAKSVGVLADSLNKLTDSLGNIKTEELAKLSTIAGATGTRTETAPAATTMSTEGIEAKLDKLTDLLVGGAIKVNIDGKLVSSAVANTAGR